MRQTAVELGGHLEVVASELGGASFRLILPASAVRPDGSPEMWRNGATWPQLRAQAGGREPGDSEGEGEPEPIIDFRRAVNSW